MNGVPVHESKTVIYPSVTYHTPTGETWMDDDSPVVDFVEQLVRLRFSEEGIAAAVAAKINTSELSVGVSLVNHLGDINAYVYVMVSKLP